MLDMKIFKKIKREKILLNLIILSIWILYFLLLYLNFFDILSISWFWLLSPLWIVPCIIVLIAVTALLLVTIF